MLKIEKVRKAFMQMVKEEIGADGYVNINKVEIYPDSKEICISGNYGIAASDGNNDCSWSENYTLTYTDGRPLEFLKGMFYKELQKSF